jgi:phage protein D
VYQHNQTDLEFLRERAARLGYEVWCEDSTLFFGQPDVPAPVRLAGRRARGTLRLKTFHPRLSSSETVQRVTVRGWNPEGREEITGEAALPAIVVGPDMSEPGLVLGRTVAFTVDHPIFSVGEAQALAKAKLEEFSMSYLTGEAESQGSSRLRPGRLVVLEGIGSQFNGKYYIRGTSHQYTHGCGEGYRTALKLRRQDGTLFFIPEIDDEVLVAFEHGDVRRPYIVGSLWDEDDDTCSTDRTDPN